VLTAVFRLPWKRLGCQLTCFWPGRFSSNSCGCNRKYGKRNDNDTFGGWLAIFWVWKWNINRTKILPIWSLISDLWLRQVGQSAFFQSH
jgi:hypothetical protein